MCELGIPAAYDDEARFEPFWARLEALGAPLYLHPRDPLPTQRRIYEGRAELLGPTCAFGEETATRTSPTAPGGWRPCRSARVIGRRSAATTPRGCSGCDG